MVHFGTEVKMLRRLETHYGLLLLLWFLILIFSPFGFVMSIALCVLATGAVLWLESRVAPVVVDGGVWITREDVLKAVSSETWQTAHEIRDEVIHLKKLSAGTAVPMISVIQQLSCLHRAEPSEVEYRDRPTLPYENAEYGFVCEYRRCRTYS